MAGVRGFDRELLKRLDSLATVNAQVRSGAIEKSRTMLCPSIDADDSFDSVRPSVPFRLEPVGRDGDRWRLLGSIDDAAGNLRFFLDLEVTSSPPVDGSADRIKDLPALGLWFVRHSENEDASLARSHCLKNWRVELEKKFTRQFFTEKLEGPLGSGTEVVGTRLVQSPNLYCAPEEGSWVLLKCDEPGPFFIGFDTKTGHAEMFPRRFDSDAYSFALDVLRTIA